MSGALGQYALGQSGVTAVAGAVDPNEKTAGIGYGPQAFVAAGATVPYSIDFENYATATAPAQYVTVSDFLSPNFDWSTFRLTEIGFGDTRVAVPANVQAFQTTVRVTRGGKLLDVIVEAGLRTATGEVYASFQSVDPVTGLPPDVLTGFLPPEDGTGVGLGHVSYAVRPVASLPTGTQIRNVALIAFDGQLAIATDQVAPLDPAQGVDPTKQARITIDAAAPTAAVTPLPATTPTASTIVRWAGQDDAGGSGVATFDVYVSDNGGAFALWQAATAATDAVFSGQNGHTYRFAVAAADHAGNRAAVPTAGQAATTFAVQPPRVAAVTVNGGQVQRSTVGTVAVRFNQALTLGANAVRVTTLGGATVAFTLSTATVNGATVATLAFPGGSLTDGTYRLAVTAAAVHDALGNALDGNGDGTAGDDYVYAGGDLFRLRGDFDGDTAVDGNDLAIFAQAFNSVDPDSTYRSWLDLDGDTAVDGNDLAIFAQRFNTVL